MNNRKLTIEEQELIWKLYSTGIHDIHEIHNAIGDEVTYGAIEGYINRHLKTLSVGLKTRSNGFIGSIFIPPKKGVSYQEAVNDYNYKTFIKGGCKDLDKMTLPPKENEIVATFNPKTYKG